MCMSRGWRNLVSAVPWQSWFWPQEMNARSLWKERFKGSWVLQMSLQAHTTCFSREQSCGMSRSSLQNCQYVGRARNSQEHREGKIWSHFPACVATAGACVSSTATSSAGLAAAVRLAGVSWDNWQAVPLPGASACPPREPKGSLSCWFPVMSWSVNEFHRFIHELRCQILLMPKLSTRRLPAFPLVTHTRQPGSFGTKASSKLGFTSWFLSCPRGDLPKELPILSSTVLETVVASVWWDLLKMYDANSVNFLHV